MAIPAQGNLPTPSGFIVQSAQGQVVLNWNQAPLATTYYVSRSSDGVTFSEVGQTAALQYIDSTGTLNQIYYYYVQAATSTVSSLPTYALAAQSLKPGQTTLGNMKLEAQQRSDLVYSSNITDQEWNSMLSQSYKELYDILIQKFGDDYYIATPYSYLTTGQIDPVYQAQVFPLPNDFYKLMRVEVALNPGDPNSWITLRKFEAIQANLFNYPNVYTFYGITNLRYRLWGSNLQIVPITSAGQTIRIWYSPRPNQLLVNTDTIDGISGYEEYVIADACMKALIKQESFEQAQAFALQKAALLKRIEEAAENRDVGSPETVSDSRRRNFAWNDPSDGGAYGGV
jgi:hypothetical protein